MTPRQRFRSFSYSMVAFALIAIPMPFVMSILFLLQDPPAMDSLRKDLIGVLTFFIFIHFIAFVVVTVCALIAISILSAAQQFTKRNLCITGGVMATLAHLLIHGAAGILLNPAFYLIMANGVVGGWVFWHFWRRSLGTSKWW